MISKQEPQLNPSSLPSRVKLKRGGKSFPLGILVASTLRSSKNEWHMASIALRRALGVYSSNRETKSIASTGVRGRNTWKQKRK